MKAKILWIEGKRAVSPPFIPALQDKGFWVDTVSTGKEALSLLPEIDPDLIIVNAASMRTSGDRICKSLHESTDGLPILVISDPELPKPSSNCAEVVLTLPFTSRKLVNRIRPILPGDGSNCLSAGPIFLDLDRKRVRCEGREANLTPRLTSLLKNLMEHPDQLIDRKELFREVWETEYTGDTRTLDVHISWLRKTIEEDPRKPRYLKTIRGVGYRLEV